MREDKRDDSGGRGDALVYCRVSTPSLAEGTSLGSQRAACVARAESLGYRVARVTEEVFSGAELYGRPELSRDRADIRAGRFKAVVAYSVDRLTRSAAHLSILSDECGRAGCRLVFVTGDSDDTAAGEARAAEVEREKIIERTGRGRRAKLLRGEVVFPGFDLYGYRSDREAKVYRVHEPEATIVIYAFLMCAAGWGTHRIASTLNRKGVPAPKVSRRPGAKWSSSGVYYMLNNPSYTGEEVCWKTKRGPGKRDVSRPETEHVRLPDGVRPALISRALWEECQEKIRERAAHLNNRRECPALLRGYVFCAECGSAMIRNYFRRGKYQYLKYRCGSRWRPYDSGCRGEAVSLEPLEAWAIEKVTALLSEPGFIDRMIEDAEQGGVDAHMHLDLEAARRAREQCASLLRALAPHHDGAANSPASAYAERAAAQAEREVRLLEKTIAELEGRIAQSGWQVAELRQLRERAASGSDFSSYTFDEQRLALRAIGFRVHANGEAPSGWRYETGAAPRPPGGWGKPGETP